MFRFLALLVVGADAAVLRRTTDAHAPSAGDVLKRIKDLVDAAKLNGMKWDKSQCKKAFEEWHKIEHMAEKVEEHAPPEAVEKIHAAMKDAHHQAKGVIAECEKKMGGAHLVAVAKHDPHGHGGDDMPPVEDMIKELKAEVAKMRKDADEDCDVALEEWQHIQDIAHHLPPPEVLAPGDVKAIKQLMKKAEEGIKKCM